MPSKGSAHRAIVKNLPISASWQDLKVPSPPPHTHTQLTGSTPSVGSVGDRRSVATICKSLRVAQSHRDAATAQRIASQLPCSPSMQLPEGRQSAPYQRSPAACPCGVVASEQHLSSASCSCVDRFGGRLLPPSFSWPSDHTGDHAAWRGGSECCLECRTTSARAASPATPTSSTTVTAWCGPLLHLMWLPLPCGPLSLAPFLPRRFALPSHLRTWLLRGCCLWSDSYHQMTADTVIQAILNDLVWWLRWHLWPCLVLLLYQVSSIDCRRICGCWLSDAVDAYCCGCMGAVALAFPIAGPPCHAMRVRVLQVGVVEFDSREDLKAAIRDLDGETPLSTQY